MTAGAEAYVFTLITPGINTESGTFWVQTGKHLARGMIIGAEIGTAYGIQTAHGNINTILKDAAIGAAALGTLDASEVLVFGANVTNQPQIEFSIKNGEMRYAANFGKLQSEKLGSCPI